VKYSKTAFREIVAAIGLPASDEELDLLWEMVADLHDQADGLRRYLSERSGGDPLTSHATRNGGE